MKKIFVLLLLSTILISCHKDYPEDIPEWLEHKIKEYKRKKVDYPPFFIEEWKRDDKTIFVFSYYYNNPSFYEFYDYSGNKFCEEQAGSMHCKEDGQQIFNIYSKVRDIWVCDFCRY